MSRNINLIYLVGFLRSIIFFGAITIPYFTELANMNYTQAFLTQSWFQFWIFFMEVPMGVISDKIGRKKTVVLGLLLFMIDMLIWSFLPILKFLLIGEFIGATGFALISGADVALIYDTLKEEKREHKSKKVFSRYQIFSGIGRVLGLALGSLSLSLMIWNYPRNYAFPFLLTGFAYLFSVIAATLIKEPKRVTPEENPVELGLLGLKKLFTNKNLRTISIFYVILSALTFFIYWLYQPLLGNVGIDVKYYGIVSAGFNLFGIFLLSQTEFISDKLKDRNVFFFASILSSFLYIGLAFSLSPIVVVASIFLMAGIKATVIPIFNHIANKKIESKNRATVLSAINMLEKILMVVFYPIVGILMDNSIQTTMLVLGGLILLLPFFIKLDDEMF